MPTSTRSHRLQFAAAILGTVGAIYGLSRLVRPHAEPPPPPPVVARAEPSAPPIVPRVDPPLAPTEQAKPAASPELLAAARAGDLAAVTKLFRPEARLDGALGAAASSGNRALVEWLLEHGADAHDAEDELEAPLLEGDAYDDVTKLLLARGAREPSLETAAAAGAPNAVARLLAKGQSPNGAPGAESPLAAALGSSAEPERRLAVVRALVAKGALVDADALGAVVAEPAERRGALVDAVLPARFEHGATARALAALDGAADADLARKLVAKGVSWSYRDGEDEATLPLFSAIERQDVALVRIMLEGGAPAASAIKSGYTPLEAALAHASQPVSPEAPNPAAEIVELVLARGASPNRRLTDGRTPLYAASEAGDPRVVTRLLERGARVNELVSDATPLDAAEAGGNVACARILRAHGGRRAQIDD